MKYWEKLLIAQKKRGLSGLTIPFLIGSQEFLKNCRDFQSIKDIVIDIVEFSSFEVNLRYCMTLNTFILEQRNLKNKIYFPTYKNKAQRNLSIAIISKDDFGETIEEVIANLEERFSQIILNKTYSADSNAEERKTIWKNFSEHSDITFIKENI